MFKFAGIQGRSEKEGIGTRNEIEISRPLFSLCKQTMSPMAGISNQVFALFYLGMGGQYAKFCNSTLNMKAGPSLADVYTR